MELQTEQRNLEPVTKKVYNKTLDPKISYLKKIFIMQRCDANPAHRNIEWTLTFEEWSKIIQQDCYFCGSKPILKEGKVHKLSGTQVPINGIDRVDSSKGYILSNVRCSCSKCNYMKHRMSEKEFIEHVKKIWEYNFADL
jgi:hypothetical protein